MYIFEPALDYPLSEGQIRERHNISFKANMSEHDWNSFGYYSVIETEQPPSDFFSSVVEILPVKINGKWTQQWEKFAIVRTADEIAAHTARENKMIMGPIVESVQAMLDEVAKTRGYDGILSLCSYATSTVERFKTEGMAGVRWRDECWAKCYEILDAVLAGEVPIPKETDVISQMPEIVWV